MATKKNTIPCEDHLGHKYPSLASMCRYWDISYAKYKRRRQQGYTIEESLTGSNKKRSNGLEFNSRTAIDHNGKIYSNKTEMCSSYGISLDVYNYRIRNGYTLKQTLTGIGVKKKNFECIDHQGTEYLSIGKMCSAWKVPKTTYLYRKKQGYSTEQALTGEGVYSYAPPSVDHLGNEFVNQTEMCDYWHVNVSTYQGRIAKGHSIEEALTGIGIKCRTKQCFDHEGNKFNNLSEMCDYWNVNLYLFEARRRRGDSIEKSLTGQ